MTATLRRVGSAALISAVVGAVALSGQAARARDRQNAEQEELIAARRLAESVIAGDVKVCDVAVLDGRKTGPRTILASVDDSGRSFCNTLLRVATIGSPRILQSIDTWQAESLQATVRDLNGDGDVELLLPAAISDYEGAEAIAVVPAVYRCGPEDCADVTGEYPAFLAMELNGRAQRIGASRLVGSDAASIGACLAMEMAYLRRQLGEQRAGFEEAVQWMASDNPALRRKAIRIFRAIGDDDSRRNLATLAEDDDPSVRSRARAQTATR